VLILVDANYGSTVLLSEKHHLPIGNIAQFLSNREQIEIERKNFFGTGQAVHKLGVV